MRKKSLIMLMSTALAILISAASIPATHASDEVEPHVVISAYTRKCTVSPPSIGSNEIINLLEPSTNFNAGDYAAVVITAGMSDGSLIRDKYYNDTDKGIFGGIVSINVPDAIVDETRKNLADEGETLVFSAKSLSGSVTIDGSTTIPSGFGYWTAKAVFKSMSGLSNTSENPVDVLCFVFKVPVNLDESANNNSFNISVVDTDGELFQIGVYNSLIGGEGRILVSNGELEARPIAVSIGEGIPNSGQVPSDNTKLFYGGSARTHTVLLDYTSDGASINKGIFIWNAYDETGTKTASGIHDVNIYPNTRTLKSITLGEIGNAYFVDGFLWDGINSMIPLMSKLKWNLTK